MVKTVVSAKGKETREAWTGKKNGPDIHSPESAKLYEASKAAGDSWVEWAMVKAVPGMALIDAAR